MSDEGTVGLGRWVLFWAIALGGTSFDLVTKSIVFARVGPLLRRRFRSSLVSWSCTPVTIRVHFGDSAPACPAAARSSPASRWSRRSSFAYWLFFLGAAASSVLTVALGLIMAGALGNCYDRLVFGYVRDFVHFHVDPIGFDCAIFNFADNMLVARRTDAGPFRLAARERWLAGRAEPDRAGPWSIDRLASVRPRSGSYRDELCIESRSLPSHSHVVIKRELIGMGTDADGLDFVGLLVPDPGVDDVGGEDVAAEQEVVVGSQALRARLRASAGWSGRCPSSSGWRS